MVEAEEQVGRGTVRAGRGRALVWAAVAWAVAALAVGAEAPADPARAAAAERACGNPAEAVGVRAAGDWELVVSELALAEAARAQARVAVEEQVLAQEELAAVQVGERESAMGWVGALAKEPHREDGRLHRRCCAGPWGAEQGACQEFLVYQEKAAAVFQWRKRMYARCWDCLRSWESRAKIRRRGWTPRPSNPA